MIEKERLVAMVCGLQEGNTEAATQLYETFREDIYYFILKTVSNDRELAEDLTQDTFVEILETIGKLQEPAAFVTWSKQIAYHKCTAYFRKRKELLADENEDGYSVFDTIEEENEEFIPDAALDKEDLKNTITAMINELPEEQKSALVLRYFNEISVKEIAQIQGVTEGTVKSRLNYGRKAIKQSVEAYEKKNGIKLHCVGIIPLLLWLFRQYRLAEGISLTAQTTETAAGFLTGGASASASASGSASGAAASSSSSAAAAAAKKGIRIGAKVISRKLIAGVAAGIIAVGGVAAGAIAGARGNWYQHENVSEYYEDNAEYNEENTVSDYEPNWDCVISGVRFSEILPENVTHIAFVEAEIPETAQTMDVSATENGGVVAWVEKDAMYVAARTGGKVYAGDCCRMFDGCTNLKTIDLSGVDTSCVTQMINMFSQCTNLQKIVFGEFALDGVTDISYMFYDCASLTELDLSNWDVSNVERMECTFGGCYNLKQINVSEWNTSNVITMRGLFIRCESLQSVDVANWDTTNVTDIAHIFAGCSSLGALDVSGWSTANVVDMSAAFSSVQLLTEIDLTDWDTSKVTDISGMFSNCSNLKTLDLSSWNTSNVENMRDMFASCEALVSVNLAGWDTSNVVNMIGMFYFCSSLQELDLTSFEVKSIMLPDVNSTENTSGFADMFKYCTSLTRIYASDWTEQVDVDPGIIEGMFMDNDNLVGAVTYSEGRTGFEMANTDGYFTKK